MKKLLLIFLIIGGVFFIRGNSFAWTENFDYYSNGRVGGQGNWHGSSTALVIDTYYKSTPHGLYSNYISGEMVGEYDFPSTSTEGYISFWVFLECFEDVGGVFTNSITLQSATNLKLTFEPYNDEDYKCEIGGNWLIGQVATNTYDVVNGWHYINIHYDTATGWWKSKIDDNDWTATTSDAGLKGTANVERVVLDSNDSGEKSIVVYDNIQNSSYELASDCLDYENQLDCNDNGCFWNYYQDTSCDEWGCYLGVGGYICENIPMASSTCDYGILNCQYCQSTTTCANAGCNWSDATNFCYQESAISLMQCGTGENCQYCYNEQLCDGQEGCYWGTLLTGWLAGGYCYSTSTEGGSFWYSTSSIRSQLGDKIPFFFIYTFLDGISYLANTNATGTIAPISLTIPDIDYASTSVFDEFEMSIFDQDIIFSFVSESAFAQIRQLLGVFIWLALFFSFRHLPKRISNLNS